MLDIKSYVVIKKQEIKEKISKLVIKPCLCVVQVNDDEASCAYIRGKKKDCEEVGIIFKLIKLDANTSEKELIGLIDKLNLDDEINAILVQMPLPKQINEDKIKQSIIPRKDVDGFNKLSNYIPCTPKGIIDYLDYLKYDFKSKNAVIINRSNIVGKPLVNLLLNKDCNVVVLHSKTSKKDMQYYLNNADLVISAIGKKYILSEYNFKKDAVLIDVGISRVDGKLYGDFLPNLDVKLQTPVPGGVGLLTRLSLLENVMEGVKDGI